MFFITNAEKNWIIYNSIITVLGVLSPLYTWFFASCLRHQYKFSMDFYRGKIKAFSFSFWLLVVVVTIMTIDFRIMFYASVIYLIIYNIRVKKGCRDLLNSGKKKGDKDCKI